MDRPSLDDRQPSARARQRALAIGIENDGSSGLGELRELLLTSGVATVGTLTQQRSRPDPDRYLGRGKLEELLTEIKRTGANLVACDDELAPRQERNLEKELGVPVIDRTAVILDIFASHAHTAEGKLQVELAQLEYNLARMRGLWAHLERLGAGIGTRGPGESQIETDRRLARDRIATLRQRLERVERTRAVMRAERERGPIPTVALVGYTNAGKSSLMRAITGAEVGVGGMVFQTLDPTTREYRHRGRPYLLTDTVGFIRKLPHQLVEAFKATLTETANADLIVHVVDASEDRETRRMIREAVEGTLTEIGAENQPRILAFNKLDLLDEDERRELLIGEPGAVGISAQSGEGIEELLDAVQAAFLITMRELTLFFPYAAQDRLSDLHDIAGSLERTDEATGVRARALVPRAAAHRFEEFVVPSKNGRNGTR